MIPEDEKYADTALIEQYWQGQLKGEALQKFTLRLQADAAFYREVMLQQSIMEQAKEVGREDMRTELKLLHKRMRFDKYPKKSLPFPFLAIAASLVILLVSAAILYFSYFKQSGTETTAMVVQALPAQQVKIRLQVIGGAPDMGFSGVDKDSLTTILLYPAMTGSPAYQFDDTLHLFGDFTNQKLILQYDQSNEQYILFADSLSYLLQRYRPRQTLHSAPNGK